MTRTAIEVEGAKELQKALRSVLDGTNDLKEAHKAAAEIVVTDAKPRARRLSGAMAASGRAAGQAKQGVARFGYARLNYVPIQIFGHAARNISPNPFPYDAIDARFDDITKTYLDQVDGLINKHGLR